jgi:hypothetical protein
MVLGGSEVHLEQLMRILLLEVEQDLIRHDRGVFHNNGDGGGNHNNCLDHGELSSIERCEAIKRYLGDQPTNARTIVSLTRPRAHHRRG